MKTVRRVTIHIHFNLELINPQKQETQSQLCFLNKIIPFLIHNKELLSYL